MNRIEVPRGEYSLSNAVEWIKRVNNIYNPSWIYIDRGYGDLQLEQLHLEGERNPSTGLKLKVKGWQFKQTIDVPDPTTRTTHKENLKPFMVEQLAIAFEKNRIVLSPFDDVLHKQLVDYTVDHISQSGVPVYTSENEHFVDALGLAYLAFVLEFPLLTGAIKEIETTTRMETPINPWKKQAEQNLFNTNNPWTKGMEKTHRQIGKGPGERQGEYQQWVKLPPVEKQLKSRSSFVDKGWGGRSIGSGGGMRSLW